MEIFKNERQSIKFRTTSSYESDIEFQVYKKGWEALIGSSSLMFEYSSK